MIPRAAAISENFRADSGAMLLRSAMTDAPIDSRPRISSSTDRTIAAFGSEQKSTSVSAAASPAVGQMRAPAASASPTARGERSKAHSSCPAPSSRFAMGSPMAPSPIIPILIEKPPCKKNIPTKFIPVQSHSAPRIPGRARDAF